MTNRKSTKKILFTFFTLIALSLSAICSGIFGFTPAYAYSKENTTLSNLNFSQNGNTEGVYSTPTGWNMGVKNSKAKSGAINLKYYDEDETYLKQNEVPKKLSDDADSHVLMINSKTSKTSTNSSNVQFYENSSKLKLEPYSTYKIVVWAQVTTTAKASIYVEGLEETFGFENINVEHAESWNDYTFYISTGIKSEEVKLQLYLGSKPLNKSTGAVFFDNVSVHQISRDQVPGITPASSPVSTPNSRLDKVKYINLNESVLLSGLDKDNNLVNLNADFETTNLTNWHSIGAMKSGTFAEILNLETASVSSAKGITYLGTDLFKSNKNALVLYTNKNVKSNFGLKSTELKLPAYSLIKISLNVKVADLDGGSAYVKFVESDVVDANGNVIEAITPLSQEIAISSNSDNKFQNGYTTVSFYVKGRSLYNSYFSLHLSLGKEDAETSGVVAFDNIYVETITNDQFSSATSGTYVSKVNMQENSESYGITNATFNVVDPSTENGFALLPNSWEHHSSDEGATYFSVINTNSQIFAENYTNFNSTPNPGNPSGFLGIDIDNNNVLVMRNFSDAYQSVTSSNFEVSANKYYKLSFAYKLLSSANSELLNVYVKDDDGNVLYTDENIFKTNSSWNTYEVYVSTNSYTNNLNLTISLGNENKEVTAILYLDNVTLFEQSSMTKESYTEVAKTSNVLDFGEGNFNLIKENENGVHTPLRFEGKLEKGENPSSGSPVALGGIIDGKDNEFEVQNSPNSKNSLNYMMMVQTHNNATYSYTAKDKLSLASGSYYKFSVDIKTLMAESEETKKETYGAEFGLVGIDKHITGIISEEWETYTIYVNATTATDVNLRFAISSLNINTAGVAFFDNYTYETIDKDTFNVDHTQYSDKANYLFVGDTDEKEDESESSSPDFNYIWYVIPTLILALALVLALVAYLMKKFKIKKWEKKKVNDYDRERTVHRDVVRAEAEKRRDEKVKELKLEMQEIKTQIQSLEEKHQQRLKEKRTSREKGISKQTEKEFKQYAKLHTALENKLASLNKEIDNMNTPEYLLHMQHKIAIEKAKQERVKKTTL